KPHRNISLGHIQLRRRQPLSTQRRFPDKVNKRKFIATVHFVHCESASKGSKWISSSQMTTVLPDFCSALPLSNWDTASPKPQMGVKRGRLGNASTTSSLSPIG